ncbi:hypothetical protein DMB42_28300 [Nonomuraea sp. WAC 01424]|uniref:hypothetical protein n=1 Tax=Nonomuraea sp. WAC 01424 TaxID=2203200 RepID=UPI000F7A1D5F|nr:hypothetical protein [Nonomuraea sp. WAC 01424]RSN05824.1 hypothetical protein DMB42_28300 [Nonomuraea sp. WAC 01424]
MNARRTALVVGTAVALTLTGSGAVSAAALRGAAADPCADVPATCSPADVAKAPAPKDPKDPAGRDYGGKGFDGEKPGDGKPGCGPGKPGPGKPGPDDLGKPGKPGKHDKKDHGISQEAFAKMLAAELGVGYDRALRAAKALDALAGDGRLDPDSAGFRAVARQLGVTPERLLQALRNVKRALSESEPA